MKLFSSSLALFGAITLGGQFIALPVGAFWDKKDSSESNAYVEPTVSVPDFKNKAGRLPWWSDQVSRQLADVLSNELSNIGVKVVERQNLKEVLSEQELSELGIVNKSGDNAAQKGQMKGAKFIILGGVSAYDEGVENKSSGKNQEFLGFGGSSSSGQSKAYVALDLRIVNSTTGEVVGSRTVEGRATSTFNQESSSRSLAPATGIIRRNFGVSRTTGLALDVAGTYKSGKSSSESNITPKSKAIRAALISGADYVNCVLVVRDDCIEEFKRKDSQRRSNTVNTLEFD